MFYHTSAFTRLDRHNLIAFRDHLEDTLKSVNIALALKRERAEYRASLADDYRRYHASGELALFYIDKGIEPTEAARRAARRYDLPSYVTAGWVRRIKKERKILSREAKQILAVRMRLYGKRPRDIARDLSVSTATVYRWTA